MRMDSRFNRRSAPAIVTQKPHVRHGRGDALGVAVTFTPTLDDHPDHMQIGELRLHMTPAEALDLAQDLVAHAVAQLRATGNA